MQIIILKNTRFFCNDVTIPDQGKTTASFIKQACKKLAGFIYKVGAA